ncbi:tetratricopeptide repeat protein [Pedobacter sp.]|uniref:tetratricopeptide repeat protein n=1 Tax=Pedobacter sp. TaxID=1411316 RepID=UPI002CAA9C2B|nr:tetratricopeptide repeat protein [Pedobacter sp.]HWW41862.1 tetratricopeptide repeat protein [Pedobacter sp.]
MRLIKNIFSLFLLFLLPIVLHAQKKSVPDPVKLTEYYENQQYTDAVNYLQNFYKEDGKEVKIWRPLAYCYMMAGDLSNAERIYLNLYALEPKNTALLYNLGTVNLKRGNLEKAGNYYKEILSIDSVNFDASKQLALLSQKNLNYEAGKAEDQLKYLIQANKLNPGDSEIAATLSEAYFKFNSFNKADEILKPAIQADSANLHLLRIKLPVARSLKQYSEAIHTGLKLLSLGDSSTLTLNHLAKSYFDLLDYKNALNYFLKIKGEDTRNEDLSYSIAVCYRGLRDAKNGVKFFNKTITEGISPKTASYYGLLGEAYESNHQNDEALSAYKRGLLFENNGSLYYNIALLYENKLNDKKNAIIYYNLYLKNFKEMDKNPKLAAFIKSKIDDLKR